MGVGVGVGEGDGGGGGDGDGVQLPLPAIDTALSGPEGPTTAWAQASAAAGSGASSSQVREATGSSRATFVPYTAKSMISSGVRRGLNRGDSPEGAVLPGAFSGTRDKFPGAALNTDRLPART